MPLTSVPNLNSERAPLMRIRLCARTLEAEHIGLAVLHHEASFTEGYFEGLAASFTAVYRADPEQYSPE